METLFERIRKWLETFLGLEKKRSLWILLYEPVREKTNNLGFRPSLTQTRLHMHRRWLEDGTFGFRKFVCLFVRV